MTKITDITEGTNCRCAAKGHQHTMGTNPNITLEISSRFKLGQPVIDNFSTFRVTIIAIRVHYLLADYGFGSSAISYDVINVDNNDRYTCCGDRLREILSND